MPEIWRSGTDYLLLSPYALIISLEPIVLKGSASVFKTIISEAMNPSMFKFMGLGQYPQEFRPFVRLTPHANLRLFHHAQKGAKLL
jgi:hypothetical protein